MSMEGFHQTFGRQEADNRRNIALPPVPLNKFGVLSIPQVSSDDSDTPKFRASWPTSWFGKLVDRVTFAFHYRRLAEEIDAESLFGRMTTELTTIGVVSALIASFAFSGFQTVPTVNNSNIKDADAVKSAYSVFQAFAFGTNLMTIFFATIYLAVMNSQTKDRIPAFIDAMSRIFIIPVMYLLCGTSFLTIGICTLAYMSYGSPSWQLIIAGVLVVVSAGFVVLVIIRQRLTKMQK